MKKLLALLIILLALSGCVTTSPEERALARQIEREYSRSFQAQAWAEFGYNARVRDISTIMDVRVHNLFPSAESFATNNLRGMVRIGRDESFSARFYSAENRIVSTRNYYTLVESMEDFFRALGLDIIESRIIDGNTRSLQPYLPNEIDTFSALVGYKYNVNALIFVTNSPAHITEESIAAAFYGVSPSQNNNMFFRIRIFHLNDPEQAIRITRHIFRGELMDINGRHIPTTYNGEAGGFVNAFQHFDISSSLQINYAHSYGGEPEIRINHLNIETHYNVKRH